MKTKEELNVLKEEVETLNKKLAELTEEELASVFGGVGGSIRECEIKKKIIKMLCNSWNAAAITGDCSIVDDLGADSLDVVDIVQVLEEEFKINISEHAFSSVRTVNDLCNLVIELSNPDR